MYRGGSWLFPLLLIIFALFLPIKKKKKKTDKQTSTRKSLVQERNRVLFDNGVTNAQKIKSNFLSNLWNLTNLYSVVNTNSFVDFLAWIGCR